MPCGRARRLLWPEGDLHLSRPDLGAAEMHVASCMRCQRFQQQMRELPQLLNATIGPAPAPPEVRERLFTALARERAHIEPQVRVATHRVVAAVAAVLVIAAAIAGLWTTQSGSAAPQVAGIMAVAEDHMRALHEESIASTDRTVLAQWLRERVAFAVQVPEIEGATLTGARLCYVNGERGAVLQYVVDGRLVSYYVMPGAEDGTAPASRFESEAKAGYTVVAWRRAGLTYALVGDLPRERLMTLSRRCAEQLAAALPRGVSDVPESRSPVAMTSISVAAGIAGIQFGFLNRSVL
ncbi:MAG: hypothetical protein ACR2GG_07550 [Gemmatimonadaceae bacterium]